MLDPTGLRERLRERLLGDAARPTCVIEEDGAGTGGALVEGKDVVAARDVMRVGGCGHGLSIRSGRLRPPGLHRRAYCSHCRGTA